jgi:hypothetical protein
MAWSDAAREAAAAARALHAQGQKNTYGYQDAKMRQARALLSGAFSSYKGSREPGPAGNAYWKARDASGYAHNAWANHVDPLGAAKHYMDGVKTLRAARNIPKLTAPGSQARADAHYKIEQRNAARRQKQDRKG